MKAVLFFSRWWSVIALISALCLLGAAHAFQTFGNLNPCHLCLKQRDIYWIAVGVSLAATVWAVFTGAKGPPRVFSFVLFAIFATGCAIAIFHMGGEEKWWALPATCTGVSDEVSIDSIAAILSGGKFKAPQCDIVAWRFLGLSMAGWNAIISGVLAILSLIASLRLKLYYRLSQRQASEA
ncbi:disulfide bond formation protein B [Asticcacaulis excentricus]|uniref:Disulfide bond formation protein DsbB n=1 Tax=Asticcacaulis excentricus (strain ATCC 15261 / DSM 4724 / KCTC 12464 / NCIMB 9791 / VKM B-1370 / CB 48) TaxID=573065 RepID=E8RLP3_ASTEC|nr:disulfide bond formation protein B [Asticcacaulis excentricus]ADU12660.1 disulfide bond formation protein DsbB [Asticcacaulis excentricus CB 48]